MIKLVFINIDNTGAVVHLFIYGSVVLSCRSRHMTMCPEGERKNSRETRTRSPWARSASVVVLRRHAAPSTKRYKQTPFWANGRPASRVRRHSLPPARPSIVLFCRAVRELRFVVGLLKHQSHNDFGVRHWSCSTVVAFRVDTRHVYRCACLKKRPRPQYNTASCSISRLWRIHVSTLIIRSVCVWRAPTAAIQRLSGRRPTRGTPHVVLIPTTFGPPGASNGVFAGRRCRVQNPKIYDDLNMIKRAFYFADTHGVLAKIRWVLFLKNSWIHNVVVEGDVEFCYTVIYPK